MALQKGLPIADVMRTAWDKLYGAKNTLWICMGLAFLFEMITRMVMDLLSVSPLISSLLTIALMSITFLLAAGMARISIKRVRGEPIEYHMLKEVFTWEIFLNILVFYFVVNIGLIFLVSYITAWIFGISYTAMVVNFFILLFIVVRIGLAVGFIVDKNMDVIKAIIQSYEATKGNTINLMVLVALVIITLIICMLPVLLASISFWFFFTFPFLAVLIWILPWTHLLYAEVYKRLALDSLPATAV